MPSQRPNQPHKPFVVYHLQDQHEGLTLAAALKSLVADSSWGQVKKWIAKRQVQVNGNLCLDEARRVNGRDVVKVWETPLAKPVSSADIRIVHLDEHIIVVEKPAGVTSVRHFQERKISTRRRQLQPTLEELLPPVLAKIQHLRWPPLPPKGMNRGRRVEGKQRPKLNSLPIHNSKKLPPELQVIPVHRLDRETSGLMLFARTSLAEQRLVSMFRRHTIERDYVGVCIGSLEPQKFTSLLVRDRGDGKRGSVPDDATEEVRAAAVSAVTHVRTAEPICEGAYSIIRCQLETGRTHQIRIHLSEAGHMLCGDKVYTHDVAGNKVTDNSDAPRHALHSDKISFTHPFTGQHLTFEMAMPADLSTWLKRLRAGQ